jgi:hypothetical protein
VMNPDLAEKVRELLIGGARGAGIPRGVERLGGTAGAVDEGSRQGHADEVVRDGGTEVGGGTVEGQGDVVGGIGKCNACKQAGRQEY